MSASGEQSGSAAALQPIRRLLQLPPNKELLTHWFESEPRVEPSTETGTDPFDYFYRTVLTTRAIDPALALDAVRHVVGVASSALDPAREAALIRLHGNALLGTGNARASLDCYRRAATLFRKAGDRTEEGRTAVGWVFALSTVGRPAEARRVFDRGLACLPRKEDALSRARLHSNLGAAWNSAGRLDLAAERFDSARKEFAKGGSNFEAAYSAYNLGVLSFLTGDSKRARRNVEWALARFEGPTGEIPTLYCRTLLASLDLISGRWQGGLDEIDILRGLFEKKGDDRARAWLHRELAVLFASLGAVEAALPESEVAHQLYTNLGLETDTAQTATLHARLLSAEGAYQEAIGYFERAVAYWGEVGHRWLLHRTTTEMAPLYTAEGQPEKALELLRKSQRYLDRRDPNGDAAIARARSAEANLSLGRAAIAYRLAQKAHSAATRHPARLERPTIALVAAAAARELGLAGDAVKWARRSVRELEALLTRFGSRQLRILVGGSRSPVYGRAIDTVLECGGVNAEREAIDLLSRARSPNLIEDLLQARADQLQPETRHAIVRLRDQLLSSGGDDEGEDLRSRSLRRQMSRLDRRLQGGPHRPPALVRRALENRGFSQWSTHLDGRDVVLYDNHEGWRAFLVRSDGEVVHIPLPEGEAALRDAWFSLRITFETASGATTERRRDFLHRTLSDSLRSLDRLREALWDPIPFTSGRVVVIPYRELHSLPLESLDTAGRTVSRLPHPSLLRRGRRASRKNVLLLSGPESGMREEVVDIESQMHALGYEVETGDTRRDLERVAGPVGALHVAAHGTFHRMGWLMSGLQLSDGWIGFEHLRRNQLQGALVQFTSCESGMVELMPGSDFDGWISAALGAGARELVLTAWRIDTASARGFAKPFYASWATGIDAPASARSARAELRAKFPHPYYWCPFVVVG